MMMDALRRREQRNKELIKRMSDPEDCMTQFSKEQSWYPERPIIEKDESGMRKLYGEQLSKKNNGRT
jgi:hypothetical protein